MAEAQSLFLIAEKKRQREELAPVSFEEEWLLPFITMEIERLILEEKLPLFSLCYSYQGSLPSPKSPPIFGKRGVKSYVKQREI